MFIFNFDYKTITDMKNSLIAKISNKQHTKKHLVKQTKIYLFLDLSTLDKNLMSFEHFSVLKACF